MSLRQINLDDCNSSYVNWLNDSEVNQYLETKWHKQSLTTISEFVQNMIDSSNQLLLAIIDKQTNMHIGNIKIGPIHEHYNHADVSYFIGEKQFWNKGYATEAIEIACAYGFEDLNLHRMEAGVYEQAVGSRKALEHNGFVREAVFREQVLFMDKYIDVFRYGLLKSDWEKTKRRNGNI